VNSFRTVAVCIAVAVLALSAGYATHELLGETTGPAPVSEAADVDALFAAQLPDLKGVDTSLNRWRGSILVVNFWATWCAPCKEEMPSFVTLQRELADKGVQFVGIAADQPDKVRQFAADLQLNYPVLIGGMDVLDLSAKVGNRISALPFTVVLDRQGRIAHRQLGILKPDKLRSIVERLA
jgi:thiol-disulfide isomerase/thioredoxin